MYMFFLPTQAISRIKIAFDLLCIFTNYYGYIFIMLQSDKPWSCDVTELAMTVSHSNGYQYSLFPSYMIESSILLHPCPEMILGSFFLIGTLVHFYQWKQRISKIKSLKKFPPLFSKSPRLIFETSLKLKVYKLLSEKS